MKFLVLWHFNMARVGTDAMRAVVEQMPKYTQRLESDKKLISRYHIVGKHGGAWIYDVTSNEELDRLLATSPVYNYAEYEVIALAEMTDPLTVGGK